MSSIIYKGRQLGRSHAEALFNKGVLMTGGTVMSVTNDGLPPTDLIERLKILGVDVHYEPIYTKPKFGWFGELIGIKTFDKKISGYKLSLKP